MRPFPNSIRHGRHALGDARGVALITALAMLFLFSFLGTAYVSYMSIEQDAARYELREVRARHLAVGGVNAAIGEIQAAMKNGVVPATVYDFRIPVIVQEAGGLADYPQEVHVEIVDESGLINLNYAPREVLEAVGMERGSVRTLKASVPHPEDPSNPERRRLLSFDELRSRNLVTPKEAERLNRGLFTVYTGDDPSNPAHYVNLNAAAPAVLAAIFNVPIAEAEAVAALRPFASWQDVLDKVKRDPGTFNMRPPAQAPHEMPIELALSSNCFRIKSVASIDPKGSARGYRSRAETVVIFKADGSQEVRFWSKTPSELLELDVPVAASEAGEVTAPEGTEVQTTPPAAESAPVSAVPQQP